MDISLPLDPDADGVTGHMLDAGRRTLPIIVVKRAGQPVAYLNSCPHAGVRLDLPPHGFLDMTGTLLKCSLHGALFEPGNGRCTAGPCKGSRLVALKAHVAPDGRLVLEDVEKIPARAFQTR